MNWVAAHARGSVLSLVVAPRSSTNALQAMPDGTLRVRLTAPPVDGAANAALLRFLADLLEIPRTRLTIASGESSRRKRVIVTDMSANDLVKRLEDVLSKGNRPS